jgi:hypothetical protein
MKLHAFVAAATLCAASSASAYFNLSVVSVTPTDLTLSISGTLGLPSGQSIPDTHAKWLTLESPGTEWITNDGTHDITLVQTGLAPLSNATLDWGADPFASRGDSFGDYVRLNFYYDLVAGTSQGSGNEFTLHSNTPIFRTSGYSIGLYWSWRGEWPQPFGVYQSSAVVPEPSSYALFGGVAALGLAALVRRRRQK